MGRILEQRYIFTTGGVDENVQEKSSKPKRLKKNS